MGEKDKIPVRVVVKKKKDHGGSHGGAWKVAYADFGRDRPQQLNGLRF